MGIEGNLEHSMKRTFPGGHKQKDQLLALLANPKPVDDLLQESALATSPYAVLGNLNGEHLQEPEWLADQIYGGVTEIAVLHDFILHSLHAAFPVMWSRVVISSTPVNASLAHIPHQIALWALSDREWGLQSLLPDSFQQDSASLFVMLETASPDLHWDQALREEIRANIMGQFGKLALLPHNPVSWNAAMALSCIAEFCAEGSNSGRLIDILEKSADAWRAEFQRQASDQEPAQQSARLAQFYKALATQFLQALQEAPITHIPQPFIRASDSGAAA